MNDASVIDPLFLPSQVIESKGPTNTRVYVVAVYFRDQARREDRTEKVTEQAATQLLTVTDSAILVIDFLVMEMLANCSTRTPDLKRFLPPNDAIIIIILWLGLNADEVLELPFL